MVMKSAKFINFVWNLTIEAKTKRKVDAQQLIELPRMPTVNRCRLSSLCEFSCNVYI